MHKMIKYTVVFRDIISYQHFSRLQIVVSGTTFKVFFYKKMLKNNKCEFSTKRAQDPHSNCELLKSGLQFHNKNKF